MTREFNLEEWQDRSMYFGMKKRFADQAAAFYQAESDGVEQWIVSLAIQLFAGNYDQSFCYLNTSRGYASAGSVGCQRSRCGSRTYLFVA